MESELVAMLALFVLALLTGIVGLLVLPPAWTPIFVSVAGLSGLGLSITGYAIHRQ